MYNKIEILFTAMHLGACAALLLRYHADKNIQELLRRLDKDKLIGTLSYSDPATGKLLALKRFNRIIIISP